MQTTAPNLIPVLGKAARELPMTFEALPADRQRGIDLAFLRNEAAAVLDAAIDTVAIEKLRKTLADFCRLYDLTLAHIRAYGDPVELKAETRALVTAMRQQAVEFADDDTFALAFLESWDDARDRDAPRLLCAR